MFRALKYFSPIVILVAGFCYWQYTVFTTKALPFQSETVITIQPKESVRTVATRLRSRNLISSKLQYLVWARVTGHAKRMKTGEYLIKKGLTLKQLFTVIESGKSIGYKLTIPEGYNAFEIAKEIEKKGLAASRDILRLVRDRRFIKQHTGMNLKSLEGYLYPNTYFFSKKDGAKKIIAKMVRAFNAAYKKVPASGVLDKHEIVTLASIIEKETGAPFERKKISSVFHNRLKKKMRLQTDPTVLYAKILATGQFSNNITRKDLKRKHPYNTYRVKGLPPGPIANPGLRALEAAVMPETTKHLYFVSQNDGTHVFTDNYKDHSAAVRKFQMNPAARRGKSWRDLKKNK